MSARVLVVESVPADARRMKARLPSGSFHVTGAGTGGDALRIAAGWQPDVVLLAVAMPDMAGVEICRRIKEDPATEGALVVMVAGSPGPELELSELTTGADDFLTQPDELAFLSWRMRRLVRFKRARDEYWARAETARELALASVPDPPPTFRSARAAIVGGGPEAALAQEWLARDGVRGVIVSDASEPESTPVDGGFDLILLDLAAIEHARGGSSHWLRKEERNRRAPLLLIGGPQDPTSTAGYGGVDDWVARPISEARLRARARIQILHRRYQARLHAGRDESKAGEWVGAPDGGAFDARYAEHHLRRLLGGAVMRDLAVLLIEVDRSSGFRGSGGRSLRAVAATLRENLRVFDTLARYGDTRFVVLMPGAAPAEALNVGERLRDAIAVASFPAGEEDGARRLTVSIGIGAGTGARSSAEALLARAENALRQAEHAGRNRVELRESA